MAAFLVLLAMLVGVVVGDLVLENPAAGQVNVFNRTITGYPQGWLLAAAAALGFLVALLLAASLRAARARRERRKRRAPRGGLEDYVFELSPRHAGQRDERPGPGASVSYLREPDRAAGYEPEPLFEQSRRATRLRGHPDRYLPPGTGHAR
jgi:uncharacterized integral membrane protein